MRDPGNQLPQTFLDDDVTITVQPDASDDIQPWISTKERLDTHHGSFRFGELFKKKEMSHSKQHKHSTIKTDNFRILMSSHRRPQKQLEDMSSALKLRKFIPRYKTEQSKHTFDNRHNQSGFTLVKCREIKPNLVDFREHYDRTFQEGWIRKNPLDRLVPENLKPKTRAGGAALNTHLRINSKPSRAPRKSMKLQQIGVSDLMRVTGIRFSLSSDKTHNLNSTHGFF